MKTGEVQVVPEGQQVVYIPPDPLQKLRAPFPDNQVGKLPRVWCKDCRDAGKGKTCSDHRIVKCEVCGQKGTSAHLHLDYVGHAEVTHRLLDADPAWYWEPFGVDANGLPSVIKEGNDWSLWIRLTVGGVTRPGVGCVTVERFTSEPYKQLISDALRNAAMRFGVALDLWAKSELDHSVSSESVTAAPAPDESPVGLPTDRAPSSSGREEASAPSLPPAGDPPATPQDFNEERRSVPLEDNSIAGKQDSMTEAAGAGKPERVAPADPLPEPDPEIQALIGRFNALPVGPKSEALALKKKLGVKNWFVADPDLIAQLRAKVTELEAVPA